MTRLLRYLAGAALAALCISGARASDWTATDRALLGAALVLHAADWSQTLRIERTPGLYERNPVLGPHPSRGAVNAYFVGTGLLLAVLADALPQYRTAMLGGWIVVGAVVVGHNLGLGLRIGF